MKLIVLGNYGTFPGRDGACSGYLLKSHNANILIDCGNGVLSRLQRYCSIENIDAIVLSHLHKDHISDMYILKYAVETKMEFGSMQKPIDVYLPLTPIEEYNSFVYKDVYNLSTISDNMEVNIRGINFKFFKMAHSVESYGMRIEHEGNVLSYTGDTVYNENIEILSQDADLFLCESTATEEKLKLIPTIPHLSAMEAATISKKARVKKLLLTHFWFEENRDNYLEEACKIFNNVELSKEYQEYQL